MKPSFALAALILVVLCLGCSTFTKESLIYVEDNYAIGGYDCLSYFDNNPTKGKEEFQAQYKNAVFLFSSEENRDKFQKNPERYLPEYGGWCAYAMGKSGEFVEIDPETYEIRDGKIYLFYNTVFANSLKLWLEENPDELKKQADENWERILEGNY